MRVIFHHAIEVPGIQHAQRIEGDNITSNALGVVIPYDDPKTKEPMEAMVPWANVKTVQRARKEK